MPYNELAGAKYPMVGMKYSLNEIKKQEKEYTRYFQNAWILK